MSSTYACQSCCGDTPVGRFISPSLSGIQVGQTVQMRAFEIRSDCNGWEYQVERGADWESTNEDVATVDDNEITFVGAGQTTIKASWNSSVPFSTQCAGNPGFLPGPEPIGPTVCCNNRFLPQSASTGVQVMPAITVETAAFKDAEISRNGGSTELIVQVSAQAGVPHNSVIRVDGFIAQNPNMVSISVSPPSIDTVISPSGQPLILRFNVNVASPSANTGEVRCRVRLGAVPTGISAQPAAGVLTEPPLRVR